MMRFWWAVGMLLVAVAAYFCLAPSNEVPTPFHLGDKSNHLIGHGVMALYFTGLVARRGWWKIFVFLLCFGIVIEFLQYLMPLGRQAEMLDVGANCLGAALGLLLGALGLHRWPQWAARLIGQRALP